MNHSAPPTSSANASSSSSATAATTTTTTTAAPPQPRPIRFVTNHDGPYAKRRRINAACLTCRRKKTRCSGERPICNTCIQNKHQCDGYGTEPDNHGGPNETGKDSANKEKKPAAASAAAARSARRASNSSQNASSRNSSLNSSHNDPAAPPRNTPRVEGASHSRALSHSHPHPHPQAPQPSASHTCTSSRPSSSSFGSSSSPSRRTFRQNEGITTAAPSLSLSTRNRMPYFRYFGPTAIMPGFKQMVVKVRGKQHSTGHTTSDPAIESSPGLAPSVGSPPVGDSQTPMDIPVYDTSAMSPSPLITHLCKLFFVHLGCSFPFLQRERFMRDLEEKQVDAILVDAVCALAARFSTHPLLTGISDDKGDKSKDKDKDGDPETHQLRPSEYGQAFAHRAKSAIPDTFPCPSVAVVQAALLLAYDEFGANRDSGLWMYLGISIRMAQDLGMQTLEGLRYEGRDGPTPKSVKTDPNGVADTVHKPASPPQRIDGDGLPEEEEQRAVERERLDTFWSLFFLDRVISSGTGRPVTLRDRDIEISFPSLDDTDSSSGSPLPFPALIRIVHLYGRVTDLLNSVKEKSHITEDLRKQLDTLEYHLTEIYQNLSPKLHFNALNFQQYVKINQGTNFLLLHCWFHTLIVLLHQPTLLKTFEGNVQHLSSNSRELSMSSAKTVADILAFTDLIDAKTGVGNPFTSQPIYIAACAFLKETALHSASSQPQSRPASPGPSDREKPSLDHLKFERHPTPTNGDRAGHLHDPEKQAAKHTLLASAANQNYQRCYRALKSIETYWAGVKYILTVMDQKAKGVGDPLLYTREEMESALEVPRPEPSFTSPGWRRKLSWGTYLTAENEDDNVKVQVASALRKSARTPIPGSPLTLPSQAIGWSLTGTMDSPSTNVAVMYTADNNVRETKSAAETTQFSIASVLSSAPMQPRVKYEPHLASPAFPMSTSAHNAFDPSSMPPPPTTNFNTISTADPVLVSDADLLLNLHSPYSAPSPSTSRQPPAAASSFQQQRGSSVMNNMPQDFSPPGYGHFPIPSDTFGDMVIDTQDVDMSLLGPGMMPWDLEYLPHDLDFSAGFGVVSEEGHEVG